MDLFQYFRDGQRANDDHALSQVKVQEGNLMVQLRAAQIRDADTERQAIKLYKPDDPSSLNLVADHLAKGGDFGGAMEVTAKKSQMDAQALARQTSMFKQTSEIMEHAGGILEGMKDPDSYATGLDQLRQRQIDPRKLGLTGNWEQDQKKIPQLLQGTLSIKEKLELKRMEENAAERQAELTRRQARDKETADFHKAEEARKVAWDKVREEEHAERTRQQRLSQQKSDAKLAMARQRLANPSHSMIAGTQSIVDADERFKDTPAGTRAAIANLLASKSAAAISQRLQEEDPTWTAEAFQDEIATQMDQGIKDGWLIPSKKEERFGGFIPDRVTPGGLDTSKMPRSGDKGPIQKTAQKGPPVGTVVTLKSGQKVKVTSVDKDGKIHGVPQ